MSSLPWLKSVLSSSLWTGVSALALAGCATSASAPQATARLEPTRGNTTVGVVTFQQRGDSVLLLASVDGLKPSQLHGFHVHEKGDCSSGDGMSAGGHFNPTGMPHGPQDAPHHGGDLPSLQADASGHAELRVTLKGLSATPGPTSVLGRSVIVHAGEDDFTTQPTGNSGGRIACGVLGLG